MWSAQGLVKFKVVAEKKLREAELERRDAART